MNLVQRIATVVGCAALVSSTLVPSAVAGTPAWQRAADVDVGAFRFIAPVPPLTVVVPTVVELEVPYDALPQYSTGVVRDDAGIDTGMWSPLYEESKEAEYVLDAESSAVNATQLVDGLYDTAGDFTFVEGEQNRAVVTLTLSEARLVSGLVLMPDAYVALPTYVTVRALMHDGVKPLVVRARGAEVVRFPETEAEVFEVELEYVQPLRLRELGLVSAAERAATKTLRFLAQPERSYTLYLSPDRSYGTPLEQDANLTGDDEVVVLGDVMVRPNPAYVPPDSDGDGIADRMDNCVSIENADQADRDGNGSGDACDDFDRDGVQGAVDNCAFIPNRDQRDTDGDGVGDVCDDNEDRFTERNPWVPWVGLGFAALVIGGLLFDTLHTRRTPPVPPEEDTTASE